MDGDVLIVAWNADQNGAALIGSEFVGLLDEADESGILHKDIDPLLADDLTDPITDVSPEELMQWVAPYRRAISSL